MRSNWRQMTRVRSLSDDFYGKCLESGADTDKTERQFSNRATLTNSISTAIIGSCLRKLGRVVNVSDYNWFNFQLNRMNSFCAKNSET